MEAKKTGKFVCPVCNLRYNKKAREPIFMQCCHQTACKTCVLTKMSQCTAERSVLEAKEITGTFKCSLCQCEKYCPPGIDKQLPISINKFVLEMLDEFDDMLPVTSDNHPSSLVSWYNKKTKKIICNEEYYANPDTIRDHVPIDRKNVDNFFAQAKDSLHNFNMMITEII